MAKMKPMDFYESFHFLHNHRIFKGGFLESLDIEVVKVDPKTKRIEDNRSGNTRTQVWRECGPPYKEKQIESFPVCWTHDIDLDCGGDTFEEAIIRLAELVLKKYGWDEI